MRGRPKRTADPDWIAFAGAGGGLFSLGVLPFLTLRPNRILEGAPLGILEALGPWALLPLALLGILSALSLRGGKGGHVDAAASLAAGLALAILFPFAGSASGRLVGDSSVARVSAGLGFWIAAVGAAAALFSVNRRLAGRPLVRALASLAAPIAILAAGLSGSLGGLSLLRELASRRESYGAELGRHLALALSSAALGSAVGIPLGLSMHHYPRWRPVASVLVSTAQVVPALSLLGLLIAPLAALGASSPALSSLGVRGVGWAPAFVVLFLYALLPIAGNTFAALGAVEPGSLDAARGMGMSQRQVFLRVQAPLALPVIFSGMRTAFVQNMGNTVLAALVGGGGLGTLVFLGLAQAAPDLILLGALSVAGLALAADRVLAFAFTLAVSKGIRPEPS